MINSEVLQMIGEGMISSSSSDYRVESLLGTGTFGAVAQCYKIATNETVAVKIIKDQKHTEKAKKEERILQQMKELNSDKFNIVKWNESFTYREHYCLEFEMLGLSLRQFLMIHWSRRLELKEIRPIMHQLATALQFLKSAGIVHADLKLENIMMVDHVQKPLRVKVIDFGLALTKPKLWIGLAIQSLFYRAPEILLGAPFSEAIDVWSLGCIGAELLMGEPLFPGKNTHDMIKRQVYVVGNPPDDLLNVALHTEKFFMRTQTSEWQFRSPFDASIYTYPYIVTNLNDLAKVSRKTSETDARADSSDIMSYIDLLTKMLQPDPSKRITSSQILQHPFLTMSHFDGMLDSLYVKSCSRLMASCQGPSSGGDQDVAQKETSSITAALAAHHDEGRPAGLSAVCPKNSLMKKERRDDESECGNSEKRKEFPEDKSPAKKSVTLEKELPQNLKKAEAAQSSMTQVSHANKRKRADDEEKEKEKETSSSTAALAAHHDSILPTKKRKEFPEDKSPAKRSVRLQKKLPQNLKKAEAAQSSMTQVSHANKRKRADDEEKEKEKEKETSSSTAALATHHDSILPTKKRKEFPEDKSPAKRSVRLQKKLPQNLKKAEAAQSSMTQVSHANKRKRADDEEKEKETSSSTAALAAHHGSILPREKKKELPEDKSPAKRSVRLQKKLPQNLKNAAQSSMTQVSHVNKRKRADDEEKEKEKEEGSPCKRRRGCGWRR